jgi:hypothetical protein
VKTWIYSALGVGAIVAIILAVTGGGEATHKKPRHRAQARPLTEKRVRKYIEFVTERDRILQPRTSGGRIQPKSAPEIVPLMRRLHARLELTESQSRQLVRQVDRAVAAINWTETTTSKKGNLESRRNLWASKKPHDKQEERKINEELARIDEALSGPQAPESDKAVVLKFWADVNKIATRTFGE